MLLRARTALSKQMRSPRKRGGAVDSHQCIVAIGKPTRGFFKGVEGGKETEAFLEAAPCPGRTFGDLSECVGRGTEIDGMKGRHLPLRKDEFGQMLRTLRRGMHDCMTPFKRI